MAKAETRSTPTGAKGEAATTHDITLKVGGSIVVDPAGETLVIKQIDKDRIVFERDESAPAEQS